MIAWLISDWCRPYRELEEYSAIDFEENEIDEEDADYRLHHQRVEQKSVEEWLQTVVQWVVFINVIYIYWINIEYWKLQWLHRALEAVGSFCLSGLFVVVLQVSISTADV